LYFRNLKKHYPRIIFNMMHNKISKTIICLSVFICFHTLSVAQLTVGTTMTPTQLVQNVLVGSGVTVSNVTYTGYANAIGSFTTGATPTNLGISNGIVMSTGDITLPPPIGSSVTNFANNANNTGSDPQLAALIPGYTVNDAAVLEFDFSPQSDTIKFRYVFASEEYPEWVGSSFNDVFGFFVSGANPYGGNYTNLNIALIPGTSVPVTINNVNSGSYSAYYVDNQGLNGQTIVYDGFTTVLTAWCVVIPCIPYHIKLAVGDAGDYSYDSAVFLEANSFTTNAISVATSFSSPNVDTTMAIEGCNNAIISFTIPSPATSPVVINYAIGGTATNGVDFPAIPTSLTIPVGQDSVAIVITPIMDGITEGTENVTITFQTNICGGSQTITILIEDNSPLTVTASNDTTICGGSANIWVLPNGALPPYTYQWDNGAGTDSTATVSPAVATTYHVTVTDLCGATATESVTIGVANGSAEAGNDTTICAGGTASLVATGGTGYQWSNAINTAANPVSPPVGTTTYYVTVTGACAAIDSVTVTVNPIPILTITASDDTICVGDQVHLTAAGALNYAWTSNPNDPSLAGQQNLANPVVTPTVTTVYTCTGSDNILCSSTSSITITAYPVPTSVFTVNPTHICIGQNSTVTYTGNAGASATYNWNFSGATIVSGTGQGPYQVTWNSLGTYQISLTVIQNGCTSTQTIDSVNVIPLPVVQFDADVKEGCQPLSVTFQNNTLNTYAGTTYLWNFGDGSTSTAENPVHVYQNAGYYDVSLLASNSNFCNDQEIKNMFIHVFPNPVADMFINPPTVSIFEPNVHFSDYSSGDPVVWLWNLGDGTTENTTDFWHSYFETGTFPVTLWVQNIYGCVDSTIKYVYVKPDYTFYIPNAFTPDGNGINDGFMPTGLGIDISNFDMTIFNRWGEQIYKTSDLSRPWDGKFKGNPSPEGVYTYKIYFKDALYKEHLLYGQVTLLR
jgi:gliding motility-associated-like protein